MDKASAALSNGLPKLPIIQLRGKVMQGTEVVKHSFGAFSWSVTLVIVLVIFCVVYFYVRRKRSSRHIDEKAGDEGED
jgi:heme/copper-type cytochrome/quinol oxidase subunit 2